MLLSEVLQKRVGLPRLPEMLHRRNGTTLSPRQKPRLGFKTNAQTEATCHGSPEARIATVHLHPELVQVFYQRPRRRKRRSKIGSKMNHVRGATIDGQDVEKLEEDQFLIESGASSLTATTRNIMTNVKMTPEGKIVTANNEVLVCNQPGDVDLRMYDPGDVIETPEPSSAAFAYPPS
jgi:hypothetical protein